MKKILVLTTRFPYPVVGGDRLRIFYMCKELSKKYSVTLLALCETREEMNAEVPADGVFTHVERVFLPTWRSVVNCFFGLFLKTPLQVSYYRSGLFKRRVNAMLGAHDLVLAHLIRSGCYVRDCSLPKVIEMTDAISMNYERVSNTPGVSGFKSLVYKVEKKRLREYEREIANDFDLSVLVSQFDKDYLFPAQTVEASRTIVCSNGVDLKLLPFQPRKIGRSIVFIGNMHSLQNMDAVVWFADEVMPNLLKKGEYVFKIVGRIRSYDRIQLEKRAGVEVTGAVDDIAETVKGACAGVCSVRLGAGVQNKVLEYMALGIPAVVSSVGSEGLEAIPGKDFLKANSEDEYIEAIEKVSNDESFRFSMVKSARDYVEQHHTWSQRLTGFSQGVAELINDN